MLKFLKLKTAIIKIAPIEEENPFCFPAGFNPL